MTNNFKALEDMIYSGRGITVGMTPNNSVVVGYTLTGRSPSSQARRLVFDEQTETIRTEVTDPEQLKDGSSALLIYPAIMHTRGNIIASNGAQTMLMYDMINEDTSNSPSVVEANQFLDDLFCEPRYQYDAQNKRIIDLTTFEPDDPNFTPRISAIASPSDWELCIVRRVGEKKNTLCESDDYVAGEGNLITTYQGGNESPLKPFMGQPRTVQIFSDDPHEIAGDLFRAISHGQRIGENFAVATAVMMKDADGNIKTAIKNRF